MTIEVVLSPGDLRWAEEIAAKRVISSRKKRSKPRFAYKSDHDDLRQHTVGCWGELAFTRALDLPWPARVDAHKSLPDVEPFWEVRWASSLRSLSVKTVWDPEEGGDHPFELVAFVTGQAPGFEIHGYVVADWAQRNLPAVDRNNAGRPAHWVNPYSLTPIEPDFHDMHAWSNGYAGREGWLCLICGIPFA